MNTIRKSYIGWQRTIVKFRNGMLCLAVSDIESVDDLDGNNAFMVYDPSKRKFTGAKFLHCYDEDLMNTLSISRIINRCDTICGTSSPLTYDDVRDASLSDHDWDVVAMNVYPYAINAFNIITGGAEILFGRTR